jgi:hypothetical protein
MRAGTVVLARMPSRCTFSPTGKVTDAPSSVRATTTEISRASASRRSSTHGTAAPTARTAALVPPSAPAARSREKRSNAATASGRFATDACPLPS